MGIIILKGTFAEKAASQLIPFIIRICIGMVAIKAMKKYSPTKRPAVISAMGAFWRLAVTVMEMPITIPMAAGMHKWLICRRIMFLEGTSSLASVVYSK